MSTPRRTPRSVPYAALLAAACLAHAAAIAQERPNPPAGLTGQARRVPPYFGQIGITPQQRDRIYSIRADYDTRISELLLQLEELKGEEMAACEAVLTPAQKQLLNQLRAAGRERRANRATESASAPSSLDNVRTTPEAAPADGAAPAGSEGATPAATTPKDGD